MVVKYFLTNSAKLAKSKDKEYDIVISERYFKLNTMSLYGKAYDSEFNAKWENRTHATDPSTGFRITTRNVDQKEDSASFGANLALPRIGTVNPPVPATSIVTDAMSSPSFGEYSGGFCVEYLIGVKCFTQGLEDTKLKKIDWLDATYVRFDVTRVEGSVDVIPSLPGVPPNRLYPLSDSKGIYGFRENQTATQSSGYIKWLQGAANFRFQ